MKQHSKWEMSGLIRSKIIVPAVRSSLEHDPESQVYSYATNLDRSMGPKHFAYLYIARQITIFAGNLGIAIDTHLIHGRLDSTKEIPGETPDDDYMLLVSHKDIKFYVHPLDDEGKWRAAEQVDICIGEHMPEPFTPDNKSKTEDMWLCEWDVPYNTLLHKIERKGRGITTYETL